MDGKSGGIVRHEMRGALQACVEVYALRGQKCTSETITCPKDARQISVTMSIDEFSAVC